MKLLLRLCLALLLLAAGSRPGRAQQVNWVRQIPNARNWHQGILSDANGTVYTASQYENTVHFWGFHCNGSPANQNDYDALLTRVDANGNVAWVLTSNGTADEDFSEMILNAAGNLTAVLTLQQSYRGPTAGVGITLDGHVLPGFGRYLLEINPTTGQVLSVVSRPLPPQIYPSGFISDPAVDAQFNKYYFAEDSLIVKMDPTGAMSTVVAFRGTNLGGTGPMTYLTVYDLAVGPQGDIYGVGRLSGTMLIDNGSTQVPVTGQVSNSSGSVLAFRMSPTGTVRWTVTTATAGLIGMALGVDGAGNAYILGSAFQGSTVQLGSLSLTDANSAFVARISAAGQPEWARSVSGTCGSNTCGGSQFGLAVDAAGNCYVNGASAATTLTIGGTAVPGTGTQYAASFDAAGTLRWARRLNVRSTVFNGYGVQPMALSNGGLYVLGQAQAGAVFDQQTALLTGHTLIRIDPTLTSVGGTVYLDQNGNGVRDAGEGAFPQSVVVSEANQQLHYNTNPTTGQYYTFGQAGPYALTLSGFSPHYAVSQPGTAAHSGSFPTGGQTVNNLDFGLRPLANHPDLRISLTPYGNARPGFLTKYRLTVENVGTTTVAAGTASVTLDARATYVGSSPAATVAGRTLSWSYASLPPFGRQTFDVQFSLAVNVAAGTVLSSSAEALLTGDLTPTDNVTTTTQTVTSSFDPNDIAVNFTQLTAQQITAGQPLDYTIRFQNMGTDTAFTAVLEDTLLTSHLMTGSVQLIAQSHNCQWTLGGRGLLTVRFANIKLPPRATNVIASQGFVRFRVRPQATLPAGAIIPNAARILFDYNAPVRTNTATTTVLLPTATRPDQQALNWDAYPNPATDALTIALPAGTTANAELLDALGRPVRQQPLSGPTSTLDLRTLPAGLYLLRLRTPQGYTAGRSIIRQ